MEKRVTLLRHAKSSWRDPALADHERPLSERGKRDAPRMGRRLKKHGARPSLIITSPAARARATARLIARQIGYPIEFLQREADLYMACPDTILQAIARQDESFNEILVCGHNPGITDLARRLTGAHIANVPTCGIVAIVADIKAWRDLGQTACRLAFFDYPKKRR